MDYTKPTSQMLGRFQPWHNGHTELFKKMHAETGQVVIMVRSMEMSDKDPYPPETVKSFIQTNLNMFTYDKDYVIMVVPNVTNIGYGRDVGYTIKQYVLGEDIHKISATKIRNASKH